MNDGRNRFFNPDVPTQQRNAAARAKLLAEDRATLVRLRTIDRTSTQEDVDSLHRAMLAAGAVDGHDGETLAEANDRVGDDFEDMFDRHKKSRGRYGWWDLVAGHAFTNVLVSWSRERPRAVGHVMMYAIVAMVVLVVLGAIAWRVLQ
jgi:hypothetical protein